MIFLDVNIDMVLTNSFSVITNLIRPRSDGIDVYIYQWKTQSSSSFQTSEYCYAQHAPNHAAFPPDQFKHT